MHAWPIMLMSTLFSALDHAVFLSFFSGKKSGYFSLKFPFFGLEIKQSVVTDVLRERN